MAEVFVISEGMARPRPGIEVQRMRVLDATRAMLRSRGVEQITVAELATAAGISRATFYRAFDSLDAVIDALYAEYAEQVTNRLSLFLNEGSGERDFLDAIVDAVIEEAADAREVLVAMFREELRPGTSAREARMKRVKSQVEVVSNWWQSNTQKPADTAVIESFVLLMQIVGVHVAMHPGPDENNRNEFKRACAFMIRSSMAAYLEVVKV